MAGLLTGSRGGGLPATYERKPSGRGRHRRADAPHPQAGGTGRNVPPAPRPHGWTGPSSSRRASCRRAKIRHLSGGRGIRRIGQ
jgi:hypothetical protein